MAAATGNTGVDPSSTFQTFFFPKWLTFYNKHEKVVFTLQHLMLYYTNVVENDGSDGTILQLSPLTDRFSKNVIKPRKVKVIFTLTITSWDKAGMLRSSSWREIPSSWQDRMIEAWIKMKRNKPMKINYHAAFSVKFPVDNVLE